MAIASRSSDKIPLSLFAVSIFLSALLLFQIQPLIAKLILPWFGGSAAVWTTCLMFFQLALLTGYAWAHLLSKLPHARQRMVHVGLIAISLAFLPILPSANWKPVPGSHPLPLILGLLVATIGLPYFVLSASGPLLQSWYSRTKQDAIPWRLFALSNAGSMVGLLTYPILVEPYLSNRRQAWVWSLAYCGFAALCATVAWQSRAPHAQPAPAGRSTVPSLFDRLLWMALAACASALLLAITNHLTQNVASIPFLWILPLSLYLLSFILCFDFGRWYRRQLFSGLVAVALPVMAWTISDVDSIRDLGLTIALLCLPVFVVFMVCHGEIAERRPAPAHLTSFYLTVAAGGATGGLLVGVLAPYLLNALYDLPIIVSLIAFLLLYLLWRQRPARTTAPTGIFGRILAGFLIAYCTLLADRLGLVAFLAVGAVTLAGIGLSRGDAARRGAMLFAMAAGLSAGIAAYLAWESWKSVGHAVVLARDFYGALVVVDVPSAGDMGPERILRHGIIEHGEQFLDPRYRRHPTAYYSNSSGAGLAIRALMAQGPVHIGMVGLGAGTLAAYGRPVDRYSIYELDPNVIRIAETQFTFLHDNPGPYRIVQGDARLSLENEPGGDLDFLALDAFSGDAIPVHLLTREAFALYWRHLKPDGVLAVHVTNRYLSLAPVVALGTAEQGKRSMMISSHASPSEGEVASDWVLVTSRPGFFDQPEIASAAKPIPSIPDLQVWTDDYSNLFKVLR